jgi:hypothetical protein
MTITKVLNVLKEDRAKRKSTTRARRSKAEDEHEENSVPKGFKNCSSLGPSDFIKRGKCSVQL